MPQREKQFYKHIQKLEILELNWNDKFFTSFLSKSHRLNRCGQTTPVPYLCSVCSQAGPAWWAAPPAEGPARLLEPSFCLVLSSPGSTGEHKVLVSKDQLEVFFYFFSCFFLWSWWWAQKQQRTKSSLWPRVSLWPAAASPGGADGLRGAAAVHTNSLLSCSDPLCSGVFLWWEGMLSGRPASQIYDGARGRPHIPIISTVRVTTQVMMETHFFLEMVANSVHQVQIQGAKWKKQACEQIM